MIKQHITSVITNIWGQLQGTCVFVYPEHTLTGLQPNLMGKIFDLKRETSTHIFRNFQFRFVATRQSRHCCLCPCVTNCSGNVGFAALEHRNLSANYQ